MGLTEIRGLLIDSWRPPFASLTDDESESLREQMADLHAAHVSARWRPVCVSTGQVIEALLAKRIALSPAKEELKRARGIGPLTEIALKHGLLPADERGKATIGALRVLRNWSAHFLFWQQRPSELRATQAVALLVSASESLFPSHVRITRLGHAKREPLDEALLQASPRLNITRENAEQFGAWALGNLEKATRQTRDVPDVRDALRRGLERNFGSMVRRAANVSPHTIYQVVKVLKRLDLHEHARVFAVLLPLDQDSLSRVITQVSPAVASTYLDGGRYADMQLLKAQLAGLRRRSDIISAFWNNAVQRDSNPRVLMKVMRHMPARCKATFMRASPAEWFVGKVADAPLPAALEVLRLVTDAVIAREPELHRLRSELASSLSARLASACPDELYNVVSHLNRYGLLNQWIGLALTASVVERLDEMLTQEHIAANTVHRVMWDLYCYAEEFQARWSAVLAHLADSWSEKPGWHQLCVLGLDMLINRRDGAAYKRSRYLWPDDLSMPPNVHVWPAQLGVLGAATLGMSRVEMPQAMTDKALEQSGSASVLVNKSEALRECVLRVLAA